MTPEGGSRKHEPCAPVFAARVFDAEWHEAWG